MTGEDGEMARDVLLRRHGAVAEITLGGSGYLTFRAAEELERLVKEATADASLILFTGVGRVFSLGADVAAMRSMSTGALEEYLVAGQHLMETVAAAPVPTVAAVNGAALGGGFELALFCDIRWCHPRAFFQLPECTLGVVPAWGGARRLRGQFPAAGMELLLGRRIGARTACEFGLVSRIIAGRDFAADATASARALVQAPHASLQAVKTLWRRGAGEEASALERTLFSRLYRERTASTAMEER